MSKSESTGGCQVTFTSGRTNATTDIPVEITYSVPSMPDNCLTAEPGSIEYFFLERYALYAFNQARGKLLRGRVYHYPYEFCAASLLNHDENIFELDDLPHPNRPPDSALYSPGVDVSIHWPTLLS
jgi:uncharacterized protein YqjF (DUF2071 family)